MNQLDALKKMTVVVADSGDIESIRAFSPEDATTNPSLILKAAALPQYEALIQHAIHRAKSQGGSKANQIINAGDQLAVDIGLEILKSIPGRISTEVDARLSFDRDLCLAKARKLIGLYQESGVDKSRILIKLAATWEGIRAAEILEKEGINCNLTLLFSLAQARACAEANVFLISPFVGRIYDWYQAKQPITAYDADKDPGVISVREIYKYYKEHGYATVIMGASFRRTEQILALAGCDRLTISPNLLQQLQEDTTPFEQVLKPATNVSTVPHPLTEAEFRWQHNQDAMATEKLAEGIRLFAIDQNKLETLLETFL